ncbi:hypothetical protein [Agromyces mariniharenae]|uniref:DUF2721 domain-containing protein n=1 Tax=Agromyces mariniharenae TaxID=2604423 RepID=A0A5S4V997_9MICO|nr:hypothetical protein [Agromyces mariniharenae]TYL53160.1 hypothetical protein FYC51_05525 [Agromyces mariniharenae]
MTEGTMVAIGVALIASATTLAINWSSLRSDHAGLKRIVLLNHALGEMHDDSPGKEGLRQVREALAQRIAVRMLPGAGWPQELKAAARVLTVLSILLILTALAVSLSAGSAFVVSWLTIFAAAATVGARFCLFLRENLIVKDLRRSAAGRPGNELPRPPMPAPTSGI